VEFSDRAISLADQIDLPEISYLALAVKGKAHAALEQSSLAQESFLAAISTIEQNDKEQAQERKLYSELVSINARLRSERIAQQSDAGRITELESKLQNARNAYETLQTAVYAAHPELKTKRVSSQHLLQSRRARS